jgi:hypothetical protein
MSKIINSIRNSSISIRSSTAMTSSSISISSSTAMTSSSIRNSSSTAMTSSSIRSSKKQKLSILILSCINCKQNLFQSLPKTINLNTINTGGTSSNTKSTSSNTKSTSRNDIHKSRNYSAMHYFKEFDSMHIGYLHLSKSRILPKKSTISNVNTNTNTDSNNTNDTIHTNTNDTIHTNTNDTIHTNTNDSVYFIPDYSMPLVERESIHCSFCNHQVGLKFMNNLLICKNKVIY